VKLMPPAGQLKREAGLMRLNNFPGAPAAKLERRQIGIEFAPPAAIVSSCTGF
jgi:hypothetical protein